MNNRIVFKVNFTEYFKLEIGKDHFPHYFHPIEETGRIDYIGPFPPYSKYEPKRTSYKIMKKWLESKVEGFTDVGGVPFEPLLLLVFVATSISNLLI